MNRRSFLKTATICGVSLPFLSFGKSSELEDLYAFCEQQTILSPTEGEIPFKLFPFQKQILKEIHENQFTVFVKARQIGMSYLTAAYCGWESHRRGDNFNLYGACCSFASMQDWNKKYSRFSGHPIINGWFKGNTWPTSLKYNVVVLDELNWSDPSWAGSAWMEYSDSKEPVFNAFLNQLYFEIKTGYVEKIPSPGKIILCGSPDPHGNLKRVVEESKHNWEKIHGFKVFHYPVNKCREIWTPERELQVRTILGSTESKQQLDALI